MRPRARKSLGQHFLRERGAVRRIAALVGEASPRTIFEIGPGDGALTAALAELGQPVVAVEKDERCVSVLTDRFDGNDRVEVLSGDALDVVLEDVAGADGHCVVVGNLPYNVAAPIYFRLLDHRQRFCRMVLMFQREVAERLVAEPGRRAYGSISVMTRLLTRSRIALRLPPGAFRPRPQVHSAVVVVEPLAQPAVPVDDVDEFQETIRAVFNYPRKGVAAALRAARLVPSGSVAEVVAAAGLERTTRAQHLDLDPLARLVEAVRRATEP